MQRNNFYLVLLSLLKTLIIVPSNTCCNSQTKFIVTFAYIVTLSMKCFIFLIERIRTNA